MEYSLLNKKVGKNIQKIRKENGYTQQEVANKLNFTRGHLSCLEIGRNELSLEHLYLIINLFKCKITDILPKNVL